MLDAADTNQSCECRSPSTTAPQALTFLNGALVNGWARKLAERVAKERDPVRAAYRLVPTRREADLASRFLEGGTLAGFCWFC